MINVDNIHFQFDKRGIAGINGVSCSIEEGEIFSILGPNGSGKTTLLKLLSGNLSPHKGSINLSGILALFSSTDETISINVQKFLKDSITLDIDDEKKIQLTRDLADTFEFTFQLRQNLSDLSSGQRQKVLLAKELINRPNILLLDEPFAHLDPFTRKEILASLFDYIKNQNMTVIWVTHDLSEALKFSDRIGVLNFGKFEQISSPLNLNRNPKNLFVAQYLGYRNFLPIKKLNQSWMTPWGKIDQEMISNEEALLVIPDGAWDISPTGLDMKIKKYYAQEQKAEYVLSFNEHTFYMTKSFFLEVAPIGEMIKLSPCLKECFLISL